MKAEVVSMTADNLDMEAIRRGGDILKQGGLVAFPTETVNRGDQSDRSI